jgi:hypothetical protein
MSERAVGVDADHRARAAHAGLAADLHTSNPLCGSAPDPRLFLLFQLLFAAIISHRTLVLRRIPGPPTMRQTIGTAKIRCSPLLWLSSSRKTARIVRSLFGTIRTHRLRR